MTLSFYPKNLIQVLLTNIDIELVLELILCIINTTYPKGNFRRDSILICKGKHYFFSKAYIVFLRLRLTNQYLISFFLFEVISFYNKIVNICHTFFCFWIYTIYISYTSFSSHPQEGLVRVRSHCIRFHGRV